jgi:membrane protein YdbS with pleckstrin-like domain
MNTIRPKMARRSPTQRRLHPNVRALLQPDERVIRNAHVSGAIYWKSIAVAILALLVLLLLPLIHVLGFYLLFVAAIMFFYAYLMRYYLILVLTDKRVFVRRGIMTLDTVQLRLNRIESVELEWPPIGRLLGYSIVFITGIGSRVIGIPFISDGQEFRREMDEMLLAAENKPMHVIQDKPTPPAPPAETPPSAFL